MFTEVAMNYASNLKRGWIVMRGFLKVSMGQIANLTTGSFLQVKKPG
jgi:hypothetical protein